MDAIVDIQQDAVLDSTEEYNEVSHKARFTVCEQN